MIKISLDEAYAYDLLAISEVKKNKNILNAEKIYSIIESDIISQIGNEFHNLIIFSIEYSNIVKANADTFEAVEKARYSFVEAREMDDCNMKRYKAKIAIQNKFFPNSELLERKS
jgi:hypothetical protein